MTDKTMLDRVLGLVWAQVPMFPADPKTKKPLIKAWVKNATFDPKQLTEWWTRFPKAMIGKPTGKVARGWVLDLDAKVDEETGEVIEVEDLIAAIEEAIGEPLPPTYRVRTPRGGLHLYFMWPKDGREVRNRGGLLPHVDVRGEGGYVIAAGSRRSDGSAYEAVEGFKRTLDAPASLLNLVIKASGQSQGEDGAPIPPADHGAFASTLAEEDEAVRTYALKALDAECHEVRTCTKGGRNDRLNRAAFSIGQLVGAGVVSRSMAFAMLQDAAYACNLAQEDGIKSAQATINSGLDDGATKPRDLTEIRAKAARRAARKSRGGFSSPAAPAYGAPSPDPADYGALPDRADDEPDGADDAADGGSGNDNDPVEEDGEAGGAPEDLGLSEVPTKYDIDWMNQHFAFVLVGSKGVILVEDSGSCVHGGYQLISVEAFNHLFANRICGVTKQGKPITFAGKWMTDKDRRTYARGITFLPDREGDVSPPGAYNLWKGFSVQPKAGGDYSVLKDHILTNIARGVPEHYEYIFAWMARMIQKPRERIGVALVLRGKRGTGKTTLGAVLGHLVHQNYFLVDDPRYVTGQFNSHLQSSLLLQADEAVWAGDKVAEGRLKGLITADIQFIERKGIDQIQVGNFVHLVMTSNEDWVVPAGPDERRYAVFDVGDTCAKNRAYFGELYEQLEDGGYEALLHDLLAYDLSKVDLSKPPRTKALLEQKLVSLDPISSWWFSRLHDGATLKGHDDWLEFVPKSTLMENFYHVANKSRPSSYKADEIQFAVKMRKLVPGVTEQRRNTVDEENRQVRKRGFLMPSLADCRAAFEAFVEQEIVWPKEKEDENQAA